MAARTSAAAACAACGATVLALMLFAHPNGDDFCRAALRALIPVPEWTGSPTSFAYAVDSWKYWTGRWAAMFVHPAVLSRSDLVTGYHWLVILNGLAIAGALTLLCCRALTARVALPMAGVLVALFWSGMPSPGDGLFWFTGAFENVTAAAMAAVVVSLTTIVPAAVGWRLVSALLAGALGFVVPGLHELAGITLVAVLSIGTVLTRRAAPAVRFAWTVSTALTAAGCMVAATAPGNAFRAALYPSRRLGPALEMTAYQLFDYLPEWALSAPLLAASLAFVLAEPWRHARADWLRYVEGWRRWLVPAIAAALVVLALLLPTYALSRRAMPRTADITYLVFLVGWFTTLLVFSRSIYHPVSGTRRPTALGSAALVVLAVSLVTSGNTRTGIADLRSRVPPWDAAMTARWAELQAMAGTGGHVVVERPPVSPALYFTGELDDTPSDFRNRCVAAYFGVGSVVLGSGIESAFRQTPEGLPAGEARR